MSGPKADRLKLFRATGFNLSPVFGLYPDAEGEVFAHARTVRPVTRRRSSRRTTSASPTGSGPSPTRTAISTVIGADGAEAGVHRRRPPPLRDRPEVPRRAARPPARCPTTRPPPNFCLMMLVGMSDPGLIILPTHRLVSGLAPTSRRDATGGGAGGPLRHRRARSAPTRRRAWEHVQMDGSQSVLGFGTVADGQWFVGEAPRPGGDGRRWPRTTAPTGAAWASASCTSSCSTELAAREDRRHARVQVRPPPEAK